MRRDPYRPGTAPWLRIPLVRRFVILYGWRAYALMALSVVTVLAILLPDSHRGGTPSAAADVSRSSPSAAVRPSSTPAPPDPTLNTGQPSVAPSTSPSYSVPAAASCTTNQSARLVVVSIRAQHAWMCQGTKRVKDTPVTTGRDGKDYFTPTGTWQVQAKQTDRDLVGPGYSEFVHFWVPYNGDFGFHDATWQTMPFGNDGYHTQGSHGCVHVPTTTMHWLYTWLSVGSTVSIVQ